MNCPVEQFVPRLSVQLDGAPAYLYRLVQGAYEDKRVYLCAHRELLTPEEILTRFETATAQLPEEIDYDYMADVRLPDLFEQAAVLAGFVFVDGEMSGGLWLRGAHPAVTERRTMERALKVPTS